MAEKRLYKIIFLNQGKVYELFGRKVASSELWGFIEVSDLIFETGESLVVDPTEERMRHEFEGARVLHLPIQSVLRVGALAAGSRERSTVERLRVAGASFGEVLGKESADTLAEFLPFILTAMFRIPLALTVMQILAIDLGTDLLPALALGTEKPEPDVMRRPPRRRTQPLLDRHLFLRAFTWLGLIEATLCYLGFFMVYVMAGVIEPGFLPPALLALLPELALDPDSVYLLAVTTFHAGVVMAQVI